jgi:hypothetical protein
MEDAVQEAYLYYYGLLFEAMKEDHYRFLPRYDSEERTWAVLAPSTADLTLDTTVRHVSAMQEAMKHSRKSCVLRRSLRSTSRSRLMT